MDILSARKKAAELARKKAGPETSPPEPAPVEEQPLPLAAKPVPVSPSAAEAVGPSVSAARAAEEAEVVTAPPAESEPAETEIVPPIQEIEMLSFRLGEEEYAVAVDSVKEVLKNRDLTPVPNAPDYVLGIMALRGPVLPNIDLSKRLGLPPGKKDEKSRIIVVSVNEENAGIQVDRVTGVIKIPTDAVRPTPDTIEHGAEFLRGIARKGDKLYILLDIEKAIGS